MNFENLVDWFKDVVFKFDITPKLINKEQYEEMRREVLKDIKEDIANYIAKKEKMLDGFELRAIRMLEETKKDLTKINSEEFIDEIIYRINRKQLKERD